MKHNVLGGLTKVTGITLIRTRYSSKKRYEVRNTNTYSKSWYHKQSQIKIADNVDALKRTPRNVTLAEHEKLGFLLKFQHYNSPSQSKFRQLVDETMQIPEIP